MDGSWRERATAERKFRTWIGEFGSIGEARVVLAEHTADGDRVLTSWP
jgi:hypothetical protein